MSRDLLFCHKRVQGFRRGQRRKERRNHKVTRVRLAVAFVFEKAARPRMIPLPIVVVNQQGGKPAEQSLRLACSFRFSFTLLKSQNRRTMGGPTVSRAAEREQNLRVPGRAHLG